MDPYLSLEYMNESKYNKSQPEFELATSFSRSGPLITPSAHPTGVTKPE